MYKMIWQLRLWDFVVAINAWFAKDRIPFYTAVMLLYSGLYVSNKVLKIPNEVMDLLNLQSVHSPLKSINQLWASAQKPTYISFPGIRDDRCREWSAQSPRPSTHLYTEKDVLPWNALTLCYIQICLSLNLGHKFCSKWRGCGFTSSDI